MVYFISDGDYTKIGFTSISDITVRLRNLQTSNPRELKVLWIIPEGSLELEKFIQEKFSSYRVFGEWFNIPRTELIPTIKAIQSQFRGKLIDIQCYDDLWLPSFDFYKNLHQNAKDIMWYIIANLLVDQDWITLDIRNIKKVATLKRISVAKGIQELIDSQLISRKSQSDYWINPVLLYKGNRLSYYNENCPDCIEVVAEISKND